MKKNQLNSLTKKEDLGFVFDSITRAKKEEMNILAWNSVNGKKAMAEITIKTARKSKRELEVLPTPKDRENFKELYEGFESLNIYIPDLGVMLNAKKYEWSNEGFLKLELPSAVALVERRKNFRLIIDENIATKVIFYKAKVGREMKTFLIDKPIFDISSGGLSLLVTVEESKFFDVGDNIAGMTLCILQDQIDCAGIVRAIIPVEAGKRKGVNYNAWKIGVEFLQIHPSDKNLLDRFVLDNLEIEDAS